MLICRVIKYTMVSYLNKKTYSKTVVVTRNELLAVVRLRHRKDRTYFMALKKRSVVSQLLGFKHSDQESLIGGF